MKTLHKLSVGAAALMSALVISPAHAVEFGIFGDVNYMDSDAKGATNAFSIGPLDLYAMQSIDDKTRAFIEIVFENDGEGFVLDIERLWIKRALTDEVNVGAGRFHSPLGYWNTNFHHGALLQDTVSRPGFLEYEDGASAILPLHYVGLEADGSIEMGAGELGYTVFVGNGPSYDTSGGFGMGEIDINNISDSNRAKSPGFRVTYATDAYPVQVGVFGMLNDVAESGAGVSYGSTLVKQSIFGLDLKYSGEHLDVMGEYYNLKNDDKVGTAGSHTGTAYYLQFGYQLTEVIKPVYRYESLEFDDTDAYFNILGTMQETRHVFALRYDLSDTNALKFEVSRLDPKTGDSETRYGLQWAFMLP